MRCRAIAAVTLVLAFVVAAAREADAAAMVVVKNRPVEYTIGSQAFEGVLVYPPGTKGKIPGAVMVPNWMGITGEAEKQAARIARLGLAVLVADVYGKAVRPKTAEEAASLSGQYKADRHLFRSRVMRGLEVLREQKEVDPGKTIAVGYCFGGTGVLELARAGADVLAIVIFHGGLDSPSPEDGKNIKGRVVALQGAEDPFVKPEDIAAFRQEMSTYNVDWELTFYGGAVHSFTDVTAGSDPKTGAAYNAKADRRSFEVLTDLVRDTFAKR